VNIYIGNLSYDVRDSDLKNAFSAFGTVTSAKVIKDMDTDRSKGFGFVEMSTKQEGEAAIRELNGTDLQGRAITVNEARPKTERSGGGGGRNGGGRRF
jgi:cold-inducible RNA-binding protein